MSERFGSKRRRRTQTKIAEHTADRPCQIARRQRCEVDERHGVTNFHVGDEVWRTESRCETCQQRTGGAAFPSQSNQFNQKADAEQSADARPQHQSRRKAVPFLVRRKPEEEYAASRQPRKIGRVVSNPREGPLSLLLHVRQFADANVVRPMQIDTATKRF